MELLNGLFIGGFIFLTYVEWVLVKDLREVGREKYGWVPITLVKAVLLHLVTVVTFFGLAFLSGLARLPDSAWTIPVISIIAVAAMPLTMLWWALKKTNDWMFSAKSALAILLILPAILGLIIGVCVSFGFLLKFLGLGRAAAPPSGGNGGNAGLPIVQPPPNYYDANGNPVH